MLLLSVNSFELSRGLISVLFIIRYMQSLRRDRGQTGVCVAEDQQLELAVILPLNIRIVCFYVHTVSANVSG